MFLHLQDGRYAGKRSTTSTAKYTAKRTTWYVCTPHLLLVLGYRSVIGWMCVCLSGRQEFSHEYGYITFGSWNTCMSLIYTFMKRIQWGQVHIRAQQLSLAIRHVGEFFIPPPPNGIRGHLYLSCLWHKHYLWTVLDRDFIFGMHAPIMKPFQITLN